MKTIKFKKGDVAILYGLLGKPEEVVYVKSLVNNLYDGAIDDHLCVVLKDGKQIIVNNMHIYKVIKPSMLSRKLALFIKRTRRGQWKSLIKEMK